MVYQIQVFRPRTKMGKNEVDDYTEEKNEEHYYNYKTDASKFNHTSRIKAIDLERGFFSKLIEEYNK